MKIALIAAFLGSIVAANLAVAIFGPIAVIPVGLALIGLDLVSRDRLHDLWSGRGLVWRMGALIVVGALISVALNHNAARVAIASVVAFVAATVADSLTYATLHGQPQMRRSVLSNLPAALLDSFLFIAIAFPGPIAWGLVGAQFAAKSIGGLIWAGVLYRREAVTA